MGSVFDSFIYHPPHVDLSISFVVVEEDSIVGRLYLFTQYQGFKRIPRLEGGGWRIGTQGLEHFNVRGLRAFRTFLDAEFNPLSFFQLAVAIHIDGGEVDKNIVAIFASDEAETFYGIEPINGSLDPFRHFFLAS